METPIDLIAEDWRALVLVAWFFVFVGLLMERTQPRTPIYDKDVILSTGHSLLRVLS